MSSQESNDSGFAGLIAGFIAGIVVAVVIGIIIPMFSAPNDADFNKTVTYTLDTWDKKVSGYETDYRVSNLKINEADGTYSWKESRSDGSIADRDIHTQGVDNVEVTVQNDIPNSKSDPYVEHQAVYKLNMAVNSSDLKTCVKEIQADEPRVFPVCGTSFGTAKESARFVKHKYIIHIPKSSTAQSYA